VDKMGSVFPIKMAKPEILPKIIQTKVYNIITYPKTETLIPIIVMVEMKLRAPLLLANNIVFLIQELAVFNTPLRLVMDVNQTMFAVPDRVIKELVNEKNL